MVNELRHPARPRTISARLLSIQNLHDCALDGLQKASRTTNTPSSTTSSKTTSQRSCLRNSSVPSSGPSSRPSLRAMKYSTRTTALGSKGWISTQGGSGSMMMACWVFAFTGRICRSSGRGRDDPCARGYGLQARVCIPYHSLVLFHRVSYAYRGCV